MAWHVLSVVQVKRSARPVASRTFALPTGGREGGGGDDSNLGSS